MKWLVIQSDGYHKGQDGWTPNWYMRECYSIKYALEKNGETCDIWGKGHNNFSNRPNFEEYDVIFCIENYDFTWIPRLSHVKCLKIYWTIDLHCQDLGVYSNATRDFNVVLHSTRRLIPLLERISPDKKHVYFPNGYDDRYFKKYSIPKTRDFVFVGSKIQCRKDFIERLENECGMNYFFATGRDMIEVISSAKIHFNQSISCDVNYRNFETIGLGTCLLTNRLEELEHLGFKDGANCLMYDSYEEAVIKFRKSISDGSWTDISNAGLSLSERHTYTQRIKEMIASLKLHGVIK